MMKPKKWLAEILSTVRIIASKEYQQKYWVNGSINNISSWEETMCSIFDDFDIDGFLKETWKETGMSQKQYKKLNELRNALDSDINNYGNDPEPEAIFNDPNWVMIRKLAQEVLDAFCDDKK